MQEKKIKYTALNNLDVYHRRIKEKWTMSVSFSVHLLVKKGDYNWSMLDHVSIADKKKPKA